jgi:hypothetical protein
MSYLGLLAVFSYSFFSLSCISSLGFSAPSSPLVYFNRKVIKSLFRNRLSFLDPMRKLGNIPRLLHFLTVLMWMFNKLAASPAVNRVSVSSTSPSEILFSGYSVDRQSILGYPFFAINVNISCLLCNCRFAFAV